MRNLKQMGEKETRQVNGGWKFKCGICGYESRDYWKTYANVVKCVMRVYGRWCKIALNFMIR